MLRRSKDVTPQVEMLKEAVAIQAKIDDLETLYGGRIAKSIDELYTRKSLLRTLLVTRLNYMSNEQFNAAVAMGADEIARQTKIEEEA